MLFRLFYVLGTQSGRRCSAAVTLLFAIAGLVAVVSVRLLLVSIVLDRTLDADMRIPQKKSWIMENTRMFDSEVPSYP